VARASRTTPGRRLHEAAWPDMLANLQTAYAELTQAQFEMQRRTAEIEETRDLFQHVIESMSEALFLLDRGGRVLQANPAACSLLGLSADELVGMPLSEANAPEGILTDLEVEVRARGRDPVPVSVSCGLVRDKRSKIIGVLAVARDVSERKRAEEEIKRLNVDLQRRAAELSAANQELEAFSYSVSHDLRSPLRSIDGFSQAVLRHYGSQLDAQGQNYLQRVCAASQRMAELIEALLSLSRVTRAELRRDPVDLSALVAAVAAELQQRQPERQVEVVVAGGLSATGDARLLRAVVENLLGNAWKFTSKREAARIEFGCAIVDGQRAYFVRDNGAGFDMSYADKLFGPFQRLHTADEFEGTGIGLATVQRIIHRHGGRIWAEGIEDQGATFFFTL
jgi:signal transduction histidine kinase